MTILFNKKLNIKAFIRKLPSGKRIRIKPHSRKAAYMRAEAALDDLAKSKTEAGYLVSKSGKISKKVSQNSPTSIIYRFKNKNVGAKPGIAAKLHNHNLPPAYHKALTSFPPSSSDIFNSLKTGKMGAVISSKDGSKFRYSMGQRLEKALPIDRPAIIQNLENKTKLIQKQISQRKDLTPDEKVLTLDRYFQHLNKQKIIRYRSKPSESLALRRKELAPKLDNILKELMLR